MSRDKFKIKTHRGTKTVQIEDRHTVGRMLSNSKSYFRKQDKREIGFNVVKADNLIL